jgi:hypothetical protein
VQATENFYVVAQWIQVMAGCTSFRDQRNKIADFIWRQMLAILPQKYHFYILFIDFDRFELNDFKGFE